MGKVFLVGAGPGDPELLTVKAVRLLQSANVVLHDSLVSPEILDLISPHAQLIDVGKRRGFRYCRVVCQCIINLGWRYFIAASINQVV